MRPRSLVIFIWPSISWHLKLRTERLKVLICAKRQAEPLSGALGTGLKVGDAETERASTRQAKGTTEVTTVSVRTVSVTC